MSNSLSSADFAVLPGVYNAFTALLAEKHGARGVYLSGGALTSSMGIPDIGLLTLDELASAVSSIREAVSIPVVVDADTGFGGPVNVWRCVRTLEKAGADAIQIEDQQMPKRCGHLDGKEVVPAAEMVQKVRAASSARRDALIVARTDARAVSGFQDALDRAALYGEAGADVIFPEALTNRGEFRRFASSTDTPLLANMTEFGKTPLIRAEEFRRFGYRYVIFPVTTFRAAARAEEDAIRQVLGKGSQKGIMGKLMTRAEQYDVIDYNAYTEMDRSFASGKSRRRRNAPRP